MYQYIPTRAVEALNTKPQKEKIEFRDILNSSVFKYSFGNYRLLKTLFL